ncbi:glycerophosphodiester phosphodiesterase GDPD1, chloroplastic [Selaginella moellendorffii]|nr:glycerophosphodiester phosphodiesterase GDPD1, chloroplastic [Selaginella moellendorffii]|eukprot:XP_002988800.2 glycerophosphodiester phosphodiesterase GDPD1, chloroplastic [Selaginella moellendorffii]
MGGRVISTLRCSCLIDSCIGGSLPRPQDPLSGNQRRLLSAIAEAKIVPETLQMGEAAVDFWAGSRWFNGKPKLVVVGHRGCGKNKITALEAADSRPSIMENTITSFNMAAANGADFVEFDVQVTKDGHAVIFHDDLLITDDSVERAIGDMTLQEFLSIGFQRDGLQGGKSLLRRASDGALRKWTVSVDDSLCTLKQAFEEVHPFTGFNIEVKFHDVLPTSDEELERVIGAILSEVEQYAGGRRIYFSSFHPDAVDLLRKKQSRYPVFFLTDGGVQLYNDPRRNSIEAAIQVCKTSNLQGIVSEVKAVLNNPSAVAQVKQAGLSFLTYGELNNMAEALHKQEEGGVDGVIVDHVTEMVTAARKMDKVATASSGVDSSPAVRVVA